MRMRTVFLAFVTSAIVFFTGVSAASAKYPCSIQGGDFAGGAGECIFTTNAQCPGRGFGPDGRIASPIATSAPTLRSSTRAVRVAVRADIGQRE
jgi:hypothetical protein